MSLGVNRLSETPSKSMNLSIFVAESVNARVMRLGSERSTLFYNISIIAPMLLLRGVVPSKGS